MLTTHARLVANARRARTVADREQQRGRTDLSVQQTRVDPHSHTYKEVPK